MTDHSTLPSNLFPEPLNDRELDILALMAAGHTNREIGAALHLAETTVKWHNTQIYEKLAVKTRREAVARCAELGLLNTRDEPPKNTKHNLPWQTTRFVGRHAEMHDLKRLLGDPNIRLITILGAGGMGKTRLALEVARAHLNRFADGVYFVPLAPLRSAEHIVATIAEQVGLQFHDEAPSLAQLLGFFARKQMLLVLDNFEHLLDGARLVTEILRAAPQIKALVTSREKLNLSGETIYTLAGLRFPDWETPEDTLEYDAVILLLQNAYRVRPGFALQPDDFGQLARICQLTAGMPLALVLAAGWLDMLTLEQIAAEIQQGIDILESEMRDVPDRQRSVRSTFNYTWARLNDTERDVLMKLSVFRGGFTTEAAQTVAGASRRHLRKLVDKALVQALPTGRYDIHELLRQYAEERLEVAGEADATRDAYSAYYLRFVRDREADIKGRRQRAALDEIEADFENVRAAWSWALEQMDFAGIGDTTEALAVFSQLRARLEDQNKLFLQARHRFAPQPNERPHPVWGKVAVRCPTSDDVMAEAKRALEIARQHQDKAQIAQCLSRMGWWAGLMGNDQDAVHILEESLAYFREIGDRYHTANVLAMLATNYGRMGEYAAMLRSIQQSLDMKRATGDLENMTFAIGVLGMAMFFLGNLDEAEHYQREAYVMAKKEERQNPWLVAWISSAVGGIYALGRQGNIQEARLLIDRGLALTHEAFSPQRVKALALNFLSLIACMEGDYARARTLGEEARPLAASDPWEPMFWWGLIAATCGQQDYATTVEHNRILLQHFFELRVDPWLLVGVAFAAILAAYRDQSAQRATELLALAFNHPHSLTGWLRVWSLIENLQHHLQTELGDEAYTAAWERGQLLDLERVVGELLAEYEE